MVTVFSHLRKNIAVVRSESVITAKFTHSHTQLSPSPISLSLSDTHILVYTVTFRGLGLYHFYWFSFHFFQSVCWECLTFAEGVKLTQTERLSLLYIAYPFFLHLLDCSSSQSSFPSVSAPPSPSHSSFWHHCSFALSQCIFQSLGTLQIQHVKWADLRGGFCLKRQTGTESVCQMGGCLSLIVTQTGRDKNHLWSTVPHPQTNILWCLLWVGDNTGRHNYLVEICQTGRDFGLSSLSRLQAHVMLLCCAVTKTYRLHAF